MSDGESSKGRKYLSTLRRKFLYANARVRMLLSMGIGTAWFFLLRNQITSYSGVLVAWDIGILAFIFMAYSVILGADEEETYRTASQQDQSGTVILVVVVGAASASLFAIGYLLAQAKVLKDFEKNLFLVVTILTIFCSWVLTHTMFALHYAHRYYGGEHEEPKGEINRGLAFPDIEQPTYLDFVYAAFVIGMTAQVSDVQVTTRLMRRLVLIHSVFSFWFYAGILALAINLVSGLI